MSNYKIISKQYGDFLLDERDSSDIQNYIRHSSEIWDKYVVDALEPYLTRDTTLVDVGAYCGDQTIYYSKRCKKVYAFEPTRQKYYQLCANLFINDVTNTIAYNKALYHKNCRINVIGPDDPRHRIEESSTSETEAITLDSLNLESCDVIKTDCEDGDYYALTGAKETIKKFSPIIVFECLPSSNIPYQNYVDFLGDLGYNIDRIGQNNDFICRKK